MVTRLKGISKETSALASLINRLSTNNSVIIKTFPNHVKSIVETFSILNDEEQVELSRLCKKLGLGVENK